jgi:N4-gp56 family major capsid protein
MAGPVTTSVIIDPQNMYALQKSLLIRNKTLNIHDQVTTKVPFASKNGDHVKFRRYNSWALATAILGEGVTPLSITGTKTDYNGLLCQYGQYTYLSDRVDEVNQESVQAEQSIVARENMQETMDIVKRDAMLGGTSVYYANGVVNRAAVITHIEEADLQDIDRAMLASRAAYFNSMNTGSDKFGSASIRPSWLCIVHPDAKQDIEGLTGYKSVEQYASSTSTLEGEIGVWNNFRFLVTTNAYWEAHSGAAVGGSGLKTADAVNIDVYCMLIFGKDAVHECTMESLNTELIVKGFGSSGTEDPLNQRMSIGWKHSNTIVITNELNMYRYEFGVTA